VHAVLQQVGDPLFTDGAGDDQERDVESQLLKEPERGGAVKLRQAVITKDEVPGLPDQGGAHRGRGLDPLRGDPKAATLEFEDDEVRVVGAVLDNESQQRFAHDCTLWQRRARAEAHA